MVTREENNQQWIEVFMHSCYTIFIKILIKLVISPLGAFFAWGHLIVEEVGNSLLHFTDFESFEKEALICFESILN